MEQAFEEFVKAFLTEKNWPFWSAVLVLTIIGQFTSTKLFTRERAYRPWKRWPVRQFWYWMRETLMIHPIAAGAVLGYVWIDPLGAGWPLIASMMYFAAAGVVSMFAWIALRGWLKRKGIDASLPGQSTSPPAPPPSAPSKPPSANTHPLRRGSK